MRKFLRNSKILRTCKNIFAKCENFVKTMSFIAATVNCSKELEFSALKAQYLKFYYVIMISLSLLY